MGKMVILCVFYHYFIFLKVKIKDFPEAHSLDGRIHHQQTSPARNIEGIYVKKKKKWHHTEIRVYPKEWRVLEM